MIAGRRALVLSAGHQALEIIIAGRRALGFFMRAIEPLLLRSGHRAFGIIMAGRRALWFFVRAIAAWDHYCELFGCLDVRPGHRGLGLLLRAVATLVFLAGGPSSPGDRYCGPSCP